MRKRFQKGSLEKVRGEWVARWRQDGERKARKLGRVSQMNKGTSAIGAGRNSSSDQQREERAIGAEKLR